ncbi:MAG: polysaccharide biosynthesis protein [Gammaproteobacteria bacterium]|nr:polysaccharide biosynthesis protein [Gammaproteobacteria bacterium]
MSKPDFNWHIKYRHLRSRWLVLAHDLMMIPVAWLGAYWLRYNLAEIPESFFHQAFLLLPLVLVLQSSTLLLFGLYRGVWRFVSVLDLVRIFKAVAVGTAVLAVSIFFITRLQYVPRTVFIFYFMLLIALLGGPRLIYRLMKERHFSGAMAKKVLVIGAGGAAEALVRDLHRHSRDAFRPVGLVDDDPEKLGKEIHGIRVVDTCDAIPDITGRWDIDLMILAMPTATAQQMRRIVELCEQCGVPFRTLPKTEALVSGEVNVSELREVQIDDLLGREQVTLDWEHIRSDLSGKRILVTGGGGSIGLELCRQIARLGPAELIIFERSEFNLYWAELELKREFPSIGLRPFLGDVCDQPAVERVFEKHAPEIVFHAAAYKHVPLLQQQVREAVRNNVLGTRRVARTASESGCQAFVLISTDKAVNPGNLMGATKRIAEIYCQNLSGRTDMRCVTVRFGNVLGSAGSVVPLFRKQIAAGGPVTVTHPDVTRYFMTTAEATQLILQACVMATGGEIFVLNMGEPIKIRYLAEQMIRLSGKRPGDDIEIVFTGLRPGEKLSEELFYPEEALSDTSHSKILLAHSSKVDWERLHRLFAELEAACSAYQEERILEIVQTFVPEHKGLIDLKEAASFRKAGEGKR